MARTKRIFREWQHPRDDRGRFAKKGGAGWAARAASAYQAVNPSAFSMAQPGLAEGTPGGVRMLSTPKRKGEKTSGGGVIDTKALSAAAGKAFPAKLPTRRPSTFELGPKSKSAPSVVDTPRANGQGGAMAPTTPSPSGNRTYTDREKADLLQDYHDAVVELSDWEDRGNSAGAAKARARVAELKREMDAAGVSVAPQGFRKATSAPAADTRPIPGIDLNDPERWSRIDAKRRFGEAARFEAQGFGGQTTLDDDERKAMRQAVDEFSRLTPWEDPAKLDAAARKIQAFRDMDAERKADFVTSRGRIVEGVKAVGLLDNDEAVKAELKQFKKANGIPGDAAIKKLPDGKRHLAEEVVWAAKQAAITRVAAENNRRNGEVLKTELARTDLHPRTRAQVQKLLDSLEHLASPRSVSRYDAERDVKLSVWNAVKQAEAEGIDPGAKGDYNFEVRTAEGISREQADTLTIFGRRGGAALAERAAAILRGEAAPAKPKGAIEQAADRIGEQRGEVSGLAKIAADMKALHDEVFAGRPGRKAGDRVLSRFALPPGAAPREYRVVKDAGPGELVEVTRTDREGRDVRIKLAPGDIEGPAPAIDDPDDVGGTPAPTGGVDLTKPSTLPPAPKPGAAGYASLGRPALLAMARMAEVDNPGRKSNTELAEALAAKDEQKRAGLNPSGVGQSTPTTDAPKRHQTLYERLGDGTTERERMAAVIRREEQITEARAREAEAARQRAEAEANDTRTEREKITEQLEQARTIRDLGMRSGRVDPRREANIRKLEARLEEIRTEDRKAKIKDLGIKNGDKVKISIGEFEVVGKTKDGYLRILRPDGRRGSVNPDHVESVTKAVPKA